MIQKLIFEKNGNLQMFVDINISLRENLTSFQELPKSDPLYYEPYLHYSVIDETINLKKISSLLEDFKAKSDNISTDKLRDIIISGIP